MNIPCDGCKIKGVCDHIREVFEELRGRGIKCTVSMPTYRGKPVTMWTLIPQKQMPPTRLFRYCCQVLKESSTPHRMIATGVRAAESVGRRGRDVFSVRGKTKADARFYSFDHAAEVYDEAHMDLGDAWDCRFITAAKKREDLICNPIYEWSDADVWDYIRGMGIKYNPLYDQGYYRVGCVGCPLGGGKMETEGVFRLPNLQTGVYQCFSENGGRTKSARQGTTERVQHKLERRASGVRLVDRRVGRYTGANEPI